MYRENAGEETFEEVTVLGRPMLFSSQRIDRASVPRGYYLYEVRHDDEQQGNPVQIAKRVLVNHWGSVRPGRTEVEVEERRTDEGPTP